MRSFLRFSCLFVLLATPALFAANTLSTGGHNGILRSQSADALGTGTVQLGGAMEYSQEWHYIHSTTPDQNRYGSPRLMSGVLYLGVGVAPNLDIGLNMPTYYDNPQFGSTRPTGIGDLELSFKLADFWLNGDEAPVTMAYYLALQIPISYKWNGFFPRHAYYGSEGNWTSKELIVHPMLISTIHFDRIGSQAPLRLHLNFGGVVNTPKDNEALTASIGLEYFPNEQWSFFTELSAEERITTLQQKPWVADMVNDPVFITPGLKYTFPDINLTMTVAGDIGISEAKEEFAHTSTSETGVTIRHQANVLYNAYFALNWLIPSGPKDADGDGIVDKEDQCPDQAEDMDGYEDSDGCPDFDNDGDGIPDSLDKCPKEAGSVENHGCPDVDSDGDGIVDRLDKCPKEAGITANKGCPDLDTDGDGIPDRLDKCPKDAEDKDGFQDQDGCPDPDNDGDGFPDATDKCPNNPGVAETGGCPKSKEITRDQLVLKGVNFESSKAVLLQGSYKVLDDVAESLREWPEVNIEIQGHTDASGNAANNLTLSQERAETVRQYLIDKGISASRLNAVGYGQDKPIADNTNKSGRAQNRRVEINRTN
ncbi:MAG: OmpA family protein [Chitinispirillaceae bacterium]|nr:OmpA family protein [Chitinispirillaceae bacterium]